MKIYLVVLLAFVAGHSTSNYQHRQGAKKVLELSIETRRLVAEISQTIKLAEDIQQKLVCDGKLNPTEYFALDEAHCSNDRVEHTGESVKK